MADDDKPERVLGEGKYLRLLERGGWEFVHRHGCSGVAVIVAFTPANRLLLVEQHRSSCPPAWWATPSPGATRR